MANVNHESLVPPARTSVDDPGAHDLDHGMFHRFSSQRYLLKSYLESSDTDDHFSDAQSGMNSPTFYAPAAPEVTTVPEVRVQAKENVIDLDTASRPHTPGGQPIPTTVVEKLDPESPSHGDVPGTEAHEKRTADAVPDLVVKAADHNTITVNTRPRAISTPGDLPIPITKVERIDSSPSYGEVPGTAAFELRKGDAQPDEVEEVADVPGTGGLSPFPSEPLAESARPTSPARSPVLRHSRRKSSVAFRKATHAIPMDDFDDFADTGDADGFGDDFDDFEEGEEGSEFGDFDDGFQEPVYAAPPQSIPITPSFVSSNSQSLCNTHSTVTLLTPTSPFSTSTTCTPQKMSSPQQSPTSTPSSHPIQSTPRSSLL